MGSLDMMCEECPLKDCSSISQERNPSPDILFVGGYPVDFDVQKGPFTGYNSRLLRNIVNDLQRRSLAGGRRLTVDYAYACQCAPPFDVTTNKAKIDAEIIAKCSRHLKMRIDSQKPKAILAMGNDALRGLDFKSSVKEMRGGIYHFKTSDGTRIPVVVSFHIVQVAKQPGYLNTFIKDVKKAQLLANDGMQEIPLDIRIPVTPDEIISELDAMLSEINQRVLENGIPVVVSCDTETTSLTPANPDDRVIAISLSHKDRFGLAYPFQHRDFQFSEKDFQRIFRKTEELLSSPNVTVDMANAKFDIQWLAFHYKMKMNLPRYDVLLAEHILDEDKKGEYSLKDLTADRFPSMGKYESELKEIRDQQWNEKDEKIRDLQKEHLEKCFAIKLDWWLGLDADARLERCKPWISEGLVQMEDLRDLLEVKYRKLKGEMVIPKKYQQAVNKLLSNVPDEKFTEYGLVMPELVIPEELYEKTYEDIPTDVLLRYAAIDALTTRMILVSQQADFAQDVNIIKSAERHLGKQIPTRKLHEVMYDNTIPLCHRIARMEYEGVRIDRERCREYSEILQDKIKEAEDAIYTEVGRKFSLSSSSPDLGKILYEEMKLPVLKYTDKKLPSTDADTLKQLNDEHNLPFLEKLLVYRKMDKCRSTYIERWLKDTEKDGYLRAQFNQIGTATFRLSSSNPWA